MTTGNNLSQSMFMSGGGGGGGGGKGMYKQHKL